MADLSPPPTLHFRLIKYGYLATAKLVLMHFFFFKKKKHTLLNDPHLKF